MTVDDQQRIGRLTDAQLMLTERLDGWGLTDPERRAAWLLEQLQGLGWTPPRDPTADAPPLTGRGAPPDSPGRREFAAARAQLAARKSTSAQTTAGSVTRHA